MTQPVDDKIVYQTLDGIIGESTDKRIRRTKAIDYVHGLDIPIRQEYKLWLFMDYFNKKLDKEGRE